MYIDHGKNLVQYIDSYYLLNAPHHVTLQPFNVQYNSQNNTAAVDTVKKWDSGHMLRDRDLGMGPEIFWGMCMCKFVQFGAFWG